MQQSSLKQSQSLARYGLVFVLVFTLTVFAGNNLVKRINTTRGQISSAKADRDVLQEKLDNLRTAQSELASDNAINVVSALPSENSALLILAHLRQIALQNELIITETRISNPKTNDPKFETLDIDFSVEGKYDRISVLFDALPTLLPILKIKKISVERKTDYYIAELTLTSYWSSFPEKIPPITKPITGLSPADRDIISKVNTFTKAPISNFQSLSPAPVQPRENPFAQIEGESIQLESLESEEF